MSQGSLKHNFTAHDWSIQFSELLIFNKCFMRLGFNVQNMILVYLVSNHQFNLEEEYIMCFWTLSTNWYSIHVIHNIFPVYPSVIVCTNKPKSYKDTSTPCLILLVDILKIVMISTHLKLECLIYSTKKSNQFSYNIHRYHNYYIIL